MGGIGGESFQLFFSVMSFQRVKDEYIRGEKNRKNQYIYQFIVGSNKEFKDVVVSVGKF